MRKILCTTLVTASVALLAFFGTGLLHPEASADGGQPQLPIINIRINDALLEVEIANEPRQRYHGLSLRESLPENAAMLFVYRRAEKLLFTMRDTSIPLSIAFIDEDLRINEILDMEPFQDGPYPAQHLSQYALETRQGWFSRNNINIGDYLKPETIIPAGR